MTSVSPAAPERYHLRLTLRRPLPSPTRRSPRAFDVYLAELVRDDEVVCAALDVYFLRLDTDDISYVNAAAATGSSYLVRVCREALDRAGHVREYIECEFWDPLTDVYVVDEMQAMLPEAEQPALRSLFVQTIWGTMSRGMDVFFIHSGRDESFLWRDLPGARMIADLVVAPGVYPLPAEPESGVERVRGRAFASDGLQGRRDERN